MEEAQSNASAFSMALPCWDAFNQTDSSPYHSGTVAMNGVTVNQSETRTCTTRGNRQDSATMRSCYEYVVRRECHVRQDPAMNEQVHPAVEHRPSAVESTAMYMYSPYLRS